MSTELGELFDRDPLQLSDQDFAKIVARMREHQTQHELGVKPKKEPTAKPAKSQKTLDLLKSLGLE